MPVNIYLDLGANWANTLRLSEDLFPNQPGPWLTVAFEASPLIQPYLDKYVSYLNGNGTMPSMCLPRSGSSSHLQLYAKGVGCPITPLDVMRNCMWQRLDVHLDKLVSDRKLNSTALIDTRLNAATSLASTAFTMDTYFAIPASVSTRTGWTAIRGARRDLIRGGAKQTTVKTLTHLVRSIDFVEWLKHTAHEDDFVFVKIDIEGAEHSVIQKLHDTGTYKLVDALAIEYHGSTSSIDVTKRLVRQWNVTVTTENAYGGMDHVARKDTSLPAHCRIGKPNPPRKSIMSSWVGYVLG